MTEWEYLKIRLNDHNRKSDDVELLCDAGREGWELVAIQPNNVAYLKRRVEDFARETVANQRNRALRGEPHHAACRTRHHTRPRLTFPVWGQTRPPRAVPTNPAGASGNPQITDSLAAAAKSVGHVP